MEGESAAKSLPFCLQHDDWCSVEFQRDGMLRWRTGRLAHRTIATSSASLQAVYHWQKKKASNFYHLLIFPIEESFDVINFARVMLTAMDQRQGRKKKRNPAISSYGT